MLPSLAKDNLFLFLSRLVPYTVSRCHQDKRLFPSRPQPSQRNPEQLVRRSQSPPRMVGVEGEQLLTQSQVFKDEVPAGLKHTQEPAENVSKQHNHARNLTGLAQLVGWLID